VRAVERAVTDISRRDAANKYQTFTTSAAVWQEAMFVVCKVTAFKLILLILGVLL
jgi:hypothetical protein